jgi:hypothetical protein
MTDVRIVDAEFDKLQRGDLLPHTNVPGGILCCPRCGTNISCSHTIQVHDDGTVSLWNPSGVGKFPRSVQCPVCGWHRTIDHGVAS